MPLIVHSEEKGSVAFGGEDGSGTTQYLLNHQCGMNTEFAGICRSPGSRMRTRRMEQAVERERSARAYICAVKRISTPIAAIGGRVNLTSLTCRINGCWNVGSLGSVLVEAARYGAPNDIITRAWDMDQEVVLMILNQERVSCCTVDRGYNCSLTDCHHPLQSHDDAAVDPLA